MDIGVVSGWGEPSSEIARGVAKMLGASLVEPVFKLFPDGEEYVRVESLGGAGRVIVVQSFVKPASRSFVFALLLADALRESGVGELWLVAPYMGYARQDRVFLPGEPVSIRSVLSSLWGSGYSRLFTVEIHKEYSLEYFPGKSDSLSPFSYMFREAGLSCDGVVLVAPDLGSLGRVERLSREAGCPDYGYVVKERDRVTGEVRLRDASVDPGGKTVVIVDDIISTGGTVAKTARLLLDRGAERVIVMAAHYLGLEGVEERLRSSGVDMVITGNTLQRVDSPLVRYIDLSPLLASYISRAIHNLEA